MRDILLNYQKRWLADSSNVKVCEKSRRIGLTWAEAADSVITASSLDGMDIWYIGYNRDMTKEFIETCAEWARNINKACSAIEDFELLDEDKKILSFRISFESGYKITALSSRPSNLRGKQGKAIIDEAAFHDDLSGLLQSALAFTIWGGKVAIISTHFGENNAFNDLVKDVRAGKLPYSLHRITFDDAIADGLYERIQTVTGIKQDKQSWITAICNLYGDTADEELRCVPSRSGGAYLTSALIESCMRGDIPIVRFTPPAVDYLDWGPVRKRDYLSTWISDELEPLLSSLPQDMRHYFGEDFGRSGDLSVFWVLTEQPDLTLATPFIIELRNAPFEVQRDMMFFIISRLPRFGGGAFDARGNGQYLAESAHVEFGADRIAEVQATDKFYLASFPKLKSRFEDKTIIIPKDSDILSDFRQVRIINGIPKLSAERTGAAGGKRHGDGAIACLMAVYAREMFGMVEEVNYEKALKNWFGEFYG